jgi:hypothetical protein
VCVCVCVEVNGEARGTRRQRPGEEALSLQVE